MGKINSSKTDIHGVETITEVTTNKLEDFVINTFGRLFGREWEWRLIRKVERRKLRKK